MIKQLILIILILLSCIPFKLQNNTIHSEFTKPQLSMNAERILKYGEMYYSFFSSNILQTIKWSFHSVNGSKITVLISDSINFEKFITNYTSYKVYMLSNNKTIKDEGFFNIPYDGYWYVVFFNQDPTIESTIVSIHTNVIQNPILYIITPITIFVSITLFFIVAHYMFSRKKIKNELSVIYIYYCLIVAFYFIAFFPSYTSYFL